MSLRRLRVNAWTEWGRLKTVVVGKADNACTMPSEPAELFTVKDPSMAKQVNWPNGPKTKSKINAANAQLDNLANILSSRGITVLRPDPIDFSKPIRTAYYEVQNQFCCVCPRDVMATVGNNIIEASMSRRFRILEHLSYKTIMYKLWENDQNMKWKTGPKPSYQDSMYYPEWYNIFKDFESKSTEEKEKLLKEFKYSINESEILFDAADMMRMGRDIFVLRGMTTNLKGIEWLRREFKDLVRVHVLHSPKEPAPYHIDCNFVPLRPPRGNKKGLIMINPEKPILPSEYDYFYKNNWEIKEAPYPEPHNYPMPPLSVSSEWLSMNVFSIDEETVVVEEKELGMHSFLEENGFKALKVPFRDVFEFGGSLHCSTWDIEREEDLEDYFLNQK